MATTTNTHVEVTTPISNSELPPIDNLDLKKDLQGKHFLVAVDESEGSLHALKWALSNLVHSRGDQIHLLHVQPLPLVYPATTGPVPTGYYIDSGMVEALQQRIDAQTRSLISNALQVCEESAVKARTMVIAGEARDGIEGAIQKLKPDMLVMGSRGQSLLKRTFLGSVSDYCVHHVQVPVVIVKKAD